MTQGLLRMTKPRNRLLHVTQRLLQTLAAALELAHRLRGGLRLLQESGPLAALALKVRLLLTAQLLGAAGQLVVTILEPVSLAAELTDPLLNTGKGVSPAGIADTLLKLVQAAIQVPYLVQRLLQLMLNFVQGSLSLTELLVQVLEPVLCGGFLFRHTHVSRPPSAGYRC